MYNRSRKVCAVVLTGVLLVTTAAVFLPSESGAAKKTKLGTKKLSLVVGEKKTISLKGKKKGHKYTFVSKNKRIAKVSVKGVVTAVKEGTTKITVKDVVGKGKKKKTEKVGTVKITVVKKQNMNVEPSQTPGQSSVPSASVQPTESAQPTDNAQQAQNPTPSPDDGKVETPENPEDYNTPTGFDQKIDGVEYGEMSTKEYYSTTTEKNRKVNILLPLNYSEDKQYPVLYLLHGIGGDHNEWNGANPKYLIGNLIAQNQAEEMIVVMPNVRARANDGTPSDMLSQANFDAFDNFINDLRDNLMPYIKENYSILEGRENTAIAGLSMGGRESLYIGITMADTFGYIGAFSPAPGVLPYSAEGGLFTKENFKLPDEYNGKTLLMICNGDKDTTVYDNPEQYDAALTKNGTEHIYYQTSGGHDFKVWKNGLYNFAKRIFH